MVYKKPIGSCISIEKVGYDKKNEKKEDKNSNEKEKQKDWWTNRIQLIIIDNSECGN